MTTRMITREYRLAQWTEIMKQRAEEGSSVKEFCERHGISRYVYFYWQRKLREASGKEMLHDMRETDSQKRDKERIPEGWALCGTAENQDPAGELTIEIGRFRINPGKAVDEKRLESVCRVLMNL